MYRLCFRLQQDLSEALSLNVSFCYSKLQIDGTHGRYNEWPGVVGSYGNRYESVHVYDESIGMYQVHTLIHANTQTHRHRQTDTTQHTHTHTH